MLKYLQIIAFALLLICCGKTKDKKQELDGKISMSIQKQNEVIFLHVDSIKVNGFESFNVSKKYLENHFGKPDTIIRHEGEYCTSENIFWKKSNYGVCTEVSENLLDNWLKQNPNPYSVNLVDFKDNWFVTINGFKIDKNTSLIEFNKHFYSKSQSVNNQVHTFRLGTKKVIYDSSLRVYFNNEKVSYCEFIDDNS